MKRIAIVTGAASGIGRAIAERLIEDGCQVLLSDREQSDGASVAATIGGEFVPGDLACRSACWGLVDTAVERHGRVDILVNCAGFQKVAPLSDFPEDVWEQMLAVMLTAPFLLTRYAWPHMEAAGWGRIVNIGSIHSLVASANKVGYISAKHGLVGLTRTSALEGGPVGITANAICPAYVRTPLVEGQIHDQAVTSGLPEDEVIEKIILKSAAVKRLIEPHEVAATVSFLCSEAAASITGSCLTMDSGWTAQ